MKHLILLHGAMGAAAQWQQTADLLKDGFHLHAFDFPGHADAAYAGQDSLSDLVLALRKHIEEKQLTNFSIAGYSMGGYVALKAASEGLSGLEKLLTLAVKTSWSESIAEEEVLHLSEEALKPVAEKMKAVHGINWDTLIPQTQAVLRSIGKFPLTLSDIARIQVPILMLRGEADKMVSQEETRQFADAAPFGKSAELPAQGHLLHRMDAAVLAAEMKAFLAD